MKERRHLGIIGLSLVVPAVAKATVIGFQEASQGYSVYTSNGDYNAVYYGQGAVSDTGNNVWNGFGRYGGPGSTSFYGPGRPNSNPAGDPGNPYAFTNGNGSASGTTLFSPTNAGASKVGDANSNGTISPVTFAVSSITAESSATTAAQQGTPAFVLSTADVVTGSTVGAFTLSNVAAGTYNLFLYGANGKGDGGAVFSVSSGTALGGFTSSTNPHTVAGAAPLTTYVLGQDYVEFVGVTPTAGVISGTWSSLTNPISGVSEGDFNGLQLQSIVPEPSALALLGIAAVAALGWRRLRRQFHWS